MKYIKFIIIKVIFFYTQFSTNLWYTGTDIFLENFLMANW